MDIIKKQMYDILKSMYVNRMDLHHLDTNENKNNSAASMGLKQGGHVKMKDV